MASRKTVNVAMIGYKFMGKAHSNAWLKTPRFFDTPSQPVLKVVCGRHQDPLEDFAAVHAVADFLDAMETGKRVAPDFRDGTECIRVLVAGLESAQSGRRVTVSEVGNPGTA